MRRTPVRDFIFVHGSALHYELNMLQLSHIRKRIASDGHNVREFAFGDGARAVRPAKKVGGIDRASLQRLHRRQTEFHHRPEFTAILAVWIYAGIRPQRHFYSAVKRIRDVFLRCWDDDGGFFPDPWRK